MTEQQRTTRIPAVRQGVAEDQAAYRARTQAGARAPRATAAGELRDLVRRRAAALVELEKH